MPVDYAKQAQDLLTEQLWKQYEEERAWFLQVRYGKLPREYVVFNHYREKITHGTRNGYQRHLCRCKECTSAASDANKKYRKDRGATKPKKEKTHGTISSYVKGCKCTLCLEKGREYHEERRRLAGMQERKRRSIHGNREAYYRDKCRCNVCTQWHTQALEHRRALAAEKRRNKK